MTLLARVHATLDRLGVPHALVGAAALAAHGVSRATLDLDVLVTDGRTLDAATWQPLEAAGVRVDIRRGDADDPLAGVVRIEHGTDRPVDVIVGRAAWQADVLRRATAVQIGGAAVPVATAADLVLLKLYAGGPQDRWDVAQLLAGPDRDAVVAAVDRTVGALPAACAALWDTLRES